MLKQHEACTCSRREGFRPLTSMVWGMLCGCEAGVFAGWSSCAARAGRRGTVYGVIRCGLQTVVNFDRRIELFDHLKLRLASNEASILRRNATRPPESMTDRLHVTSDATSQALQDKSSVLFSDVCVNPRVLSPQAADFMLSVAASQSLLSRDESQDAGHVDLTLQGVHPESFGPVLLVCTTTTFAAAIEKSDVEKALRRAELWRRAVGPSFSVLSVVAGYALPPEVADFAQEVGVLCCDISK